MIRPFYYADRTFFILDQRGLPLEEQWIPCRTAHEIAMAIKTLAVRGAPAIGIAAAYGIALAARGGRRELEAAADMLVSARPTAVNLPWAVRRCMAAGRTVDDRGLAGRMLQEAEAIWAEEIAANEAMAELGAGLFQPGRTHAILTHCNAGSLATGGMGTGIPCTLVTDSMAGWLMKLGRIDAVIVGADRIALNLDVANKVGSYSLAVLARAHAIPFYVAAPRSTFDPDIHTGDEIPIEEREPEEVLAFRGIPSAPDVAVFNPAFDVVPHGLIAAVITEQGVLVPERDGGI